MAEPARSPGQPRQRRLVVLVAALFMALLTARLGWWQLDRAAQKRALQAQLDERSRLPELASAELTADAATAPAQYERHVRLRGRWLAGQTVFLDNRPMADRVGFYVLTPLQPEQGPPVLVQRGWVPRNAAQRTELPSLPTPEGPVEILGRLAPTPSRLYQFSGDEAGRIRQNVDLAAYARETGLALRPLVVVQLATPETAGDGLLRQWPPPAIDIHKHYGYAFQWFAMSALITGLYVWFQILQPLRRRSAFSQSTTPDGQH